MTEYFVVSALSTIRLSQGRILVSSSKKLSIFEVSLNFLGFLAFLRRPRTEAAVRSYLKEHGMEASEVRAVWHRFLEVGIIAQIEGPDCDVGLLPAENIWWDEKNIAKNDLRSIQILQVLLGNSTAIEGDLPLDSNEEPLPWFSYPAIEQLKRWDISQWRVYEYGCGFSTLFFRKFAKIVHGVESNREWFRYVSNFTTHDDDIVFSDDQRMFSESIHRSNLHYDLIVLDAHPTYRQSCTLHALHRLSSTGLIILDDSTKYANAADLLEEAGLTRIDFSGISPNEYHVQTTSFFLASNFKPKLRKDYQPLGPP